MTRHGPMGDWRDHIKLVGRALAYKLWTIQVLPALVIGAVLLGGAIGTERDAREHQVRIAPLQAIATGQVLKTWWRLDFDTERLDGDATNWAGVTQPSYCVRYEFNEIQSAACMRYGEILDFSQAPYQLSVLAQRTGVPWQDRKGQLGIELHFPPQAWIWLTENKTPYEPFTANWSAALGFEEQGQMTFWQSFLREFDRPADYLITLWQQPDALEVVFDPNDPTNAMPASFAESKRFDQAPNLTLILALFGVAFWAGGIWLIFAESSKAFRISAVIVTLVLAPWWGNWVWRGLDFVYAGASEIGRVISSDMIHRPAVVDILPGEFDGVQEDVQHRLSLNQSVYAPLFDHIQLIPPDVVLTESAARSLADNQIQTALSALPAAKRRNLFLLLACYAAADLREAGKLFVEVGRYWQSDEVVGNAASRFVNYQQDSGIQHHSIDCAATLDEVHHEPAS